MQAYVFLFISVIRCDIKQKLPRNRNTVTIKYEFTIYKNDHSEEDIKPTAESIEGIDVTEESPSKKSSARQALGKMVDTVASGVRTVASKTIGKVFSKTEHRHIEIKRTHSYQVVVSKQGIDEKGKLRQSLSTTCLIRHVDIGKCDSVSLSVTPKDCQLSRAHLFVRFV